MYRFRESWEGSHPLLSQNAFPIILKWAVNSLLASEPMTIFLYLQCHSCTTSPCLKRTGFFISVRNCCLVHPCTEVNAGTWVVLSKCTRWLHLLKIRGSASECTVLMCSPRDSIPICLNGLSEFPALHHPQAEILVTGSGSHWGSFQKSRQNKLVSLIYFRNKQQRSLSNMLEKENK